MVESMKDLPTNKAQNFAYGLGDKANAYTLDVSMVRCGAPQRSDTAVLTAEPIIIVS
jgi:hypothetical protein